MSARQLIRRVACGSARRIKRRLPLSAFGPVCAPCGGQTLLDFKEYDVAVAAALVGFEAQDRHTFGPARCREAVECVLGLRLVQHVPVPGSGFGQLCGGAGEAGPVGLGVAEFAAVFVDDPGVCQDPGEGGLAESWFAGDRVEPDVDQPGHSESLEMRDKLVGCPALVSHADQIRHVTPGRVHPSPGPLHWNRGRTHAPAG